MTGREFEFQSCLASAARWRQQAVNLRMHAGRAHLTPEQSAMLLRQAEVADDQAEWWIAGAEDYATPGEGARVMTRNRLVLDVRPRDADAPGHYDLQLDIAKLERRVRGDPCVGRLCRKMEMTRGEVLATFTPGAYLDPAMGEVGINAGYDPRFDEGILEKMIWDIVKNEARRILADCNSRAQSLRTTG